MSTIFKRNNDKRGYLPRKKITMKIGTWNIERLKHFKKIKEITVILENLDLDILVLTEYDKRIVPKNYKFKISTTSLEEFNSDYYRETEMRVRIYSKYEIVKQIETYDKYTSCCAELKTECGNLLVYGTIIGIFGNRNKNFKEDLPKQIEDFRKLSKNLNLCIIGDYNISFSDNYYFTNWGRNELNKCFAENEINNLTQNLSETIDHIAISKKFCKDSRIETSEWNVEKELSDHKGISINIKHK